MKSYRISTKYIQEALIPAMALDCDFHGDNASATFVTRDGHNVRLEFQNTMNNNGGFCEERLQSYCLEKYGMSFRRYEEMWVDRLGGLDNWWHVVKMVEV